MLKLSKSTKEHLISAGLTFATAFLSTLALQIGDISPETVTVDGIFASIVVAFRSALKLALQAFIK